MPPQPRTTTFLDRLYAALMDRTDKGKDLRRAIEAIPLWEDEWEHPERFSNPALIENIRQEGVRF